MADETYQIEIPIVVEDRTGAPLAQANERISRFERDAHKRNLQIRKHFETIARAKIEPVMRIRDSLTVDVIKAKVLVRSLGAEHAAPVLAAKDNVSTVVQRVNLLLEALEKNDVNVIADLSGPLMDEISTARNALVALGNIDSAPVAELRGNLDMQLLRATNVLRQLDHARAEPQATLRERVMARAREISNKLRGLTARTWEVTVAAKDKTTDVLRNITGALTSPFGLLGVGAVTLGPGILAVGALNNVIAFEAQMSSIKALTEATGRELAQVQALAIKMGANTKFSALEAARGIEELLKAGLALDKVRAGGLEAALNLAVAGGLELAEAAEVMATALNAYRRDGLRPSQVSDILAGAANVSAANVQDLRMSLQMVSAVASGVGMSFRDTNIALGLFAQNGLKGSDAGTSLRTMLMNLQPRTKEQLELFKRLGLMTANGANAFFDMQGRMRPLVDIAGVLDKVFGNMTEQQRLFYMETVFGSDAIRAANILYREAAGGVKRFDHAMSNVTALRVATEKMNNAAGAIEQFRGAIETMQISALMPLLPLIKDVALAMADWAEKHTPVITRKVGEMLQRVKDLWGEFAADPEFQKLGFGDKIIHVLDFALDKVNIWIAGEGGKRVQETFVKIGEIAGRAWLMGLEGMARGAVGAVQQGNYLGGAGLLAVAGLLGGGMLLRGAWGLGKGAWGLGKGAWGLGKGALARHVAVQAATPAVQAVKAVAPKAKAVQAIAPVVQAAKAVLPRIQTARKARQIVQATKPAVQAAQAATPAVQAVKAVAPKAFLGKAGRLLGRAVFPLAIGLEAATVARAQDKARAAAQGIGALGGGWGGAKLGAVIGTAMLPGVGTIIGGALGGLGGYLAGRFAAGEAVDYTRRVPVPVAAAGAGQTLGVQVHAESKPTYHIQTAADAEGVLKIIKAHEKEIADQLADDVATKLTASFQNRTLRPVFTGGR